MKEQPLYKQIYQELKNKIYTGVYEKDMQLPTELELSETYGVSRITSKRALVELENEGLIYRLRGKGSFVKGDEKTSHKRPNDTILFIMPFAQNEGFGNYAEGILEAFKDSDYRLQMQPHEWLFTGNDYTLKDDYAGILYYPINTEISLNFLYKCQKQDIPVVLIDKSIEKIKYDSVVADNESGGKVSTEHLLKQGCDDIYFVSTNQLSELSSVRDRYLGYLSALYDVDKIPTHCVAKTEEPLALFFDRIGAHIKEEINKGQKIGLVVENDVIAIKLMTHLNQMGMKIPEEVGVVGFDNIQAANLVEPPLSTVAQNFYAMGRVAAELLMEKIKSPVKPTKEHILPVELIQRGSTKITED